MTSIKLKFRSSSIADKEGTLYYQVIHQRVIRLIRTNYHVYSEDWDNIATSQNSHLKLIRDKTNWEIRQFQGIVTRYEQSGVEYSVDDILCSFQEVPQLESVFGFMQSQIDRLKQENRIRTARGYTATLNNFMHFRKHEDLSFESFDSDLMRMHEAYLKDKKLVKNSISFYMRIWRTVYNLAVEKGYTVDNSPFRHVYTGIDKTVKRAISIHEIKAIKNLDLSVEPTLELARDLFLFSFYTRGMSYIDIAYLTEQNIRYGKLSYIRRKTGQRLTIQWEYPMQEICNKYSGTTGSIYLLPILGGNEKSEVDTLSYRYKQIGRNLKRLAKLIGLNIPLTLYVARHSWASIAQERRIPTNIISNGLGHDSEKTTKIYLASLDTSLIDRANMKILNLL